MVVILEPPSGSSSIVGVLLVVGLVVTCLTGARETPGEE